MNIRNRFKQGSDRRRLQYYLVVFVWLLSSAVDAQQNSKRVVIDPLYEVKHAQTKIEVGVQDAGQRSVSLSVSYPAGKGQFPFIVFSHGHALDNQSYYNLTDYWVERGYVVAAPLHLDSGGDLQVASVITEKYGQDWIAVSRLLEAQAAIDQIEGIVASFDDFTGEVITERVIAAGHSLGALSAQQLAGATLEQTGNSIYPIPENLVDQRIVAVVAISPPGILPGYLSEKTWQDFTTPQLVVTGPNDFFPQIWPNYEAHFVSYLSAQAGHNYLLVLDEMDHYLGNLIGRLERPEPPQTLALKNLSEISLAFIESYLMQGEETDWQSYDFEEIPQRTGVMRFERR